MDGFVLIDKPEGYTSRKVSDIVGKFFKTSKTGHVGTLDPFATGLLMVMVNKATKTLICFDDFSKRYVATIKLGEYKDSLDVTGKTIEEKEIPSLSKKQIEEVLKSFLGKSIQQVPLTSAVRIEGKRLYEYAHKGESIDLPTREIEVFDIKLIDFSNDEITFEVFVSKGTYIRSLGVDIANKLGNVGYLKSLRRLEVGPFNVKDATKIDDLNEDKIISTTEILSKFIKTISASEQEVLDIKNGKITIYPLEAIEDKILIVDKDNLPIALYTKVKNQYIFRRGLF